MNKPELIDAVAEHSSESKTTVHNVLDSMVDVITDAVREGNDVKIQGFLNIAVSETKARKGRNPSTGEEIDIPAGYRVNVKAGSALKKAAKE